MVLQDIHGTLKQTQRPLPLESEALSAPEQALTVNDMIMEIHKCLVLGQPQTARVNAGFQSSSRTDQSRIVSTVSCYFYLTIRSYS